MSPGTGEDAVAHHVVTTAAPARVWDVLTDADAIGAWFAERAHIDPRPGGALELTWREHGTFTARVAEVAPPRRLTFVWAAGSPGVEPVAGIATHVAFTLHPEGTGTRIEVVEGGFTGLDRDATGRRAYREQNLEGWRAVLASLARHAEGVGGP